MRHLCSAPLLGALLVDTRFVRKRLHCLCSTPHVRSFSRGGAKEGSLPHSSSSLPTQEPGRVRVPQVSRGLCVGGYAKAGVACRRGGKG